MPPMPALLTRMSSGPPISANIAATLAESATSAATARPPSCWAVARARSKSRSLTITSAPSCRKRAAMAAPMPRAAPVIKARFPDRRFIDELSCMGARLYLYDGHSASTRPAPARASPNMTAMRPRSRALPSAATTRALKNRFAIAPTRMSRQAVVASSRWALASFAVERVMASMSVSPDRPATRNNARSPNFSLARATAKSTTA